MRTNPKAGGGGVRSLREEREAAGLSRQALATRAGCSIAAVAVFEGGYEPERSNVLPRLWAALAQPVNGDDPAGNRVDAQEVRGADAINPTP